MTNTEQIEKLIHILDGIKPEWIEESNSEDGEFDFFVRWPNEEIKDELEDLCHDIFIGPNGNTNHTNVMSFNEKAADKYEVGPGEADSFGWLTGAITMDCGCTLVYCFG